MRAGDAIQLVECLPRVHNCLEFNPSIPQTKHGVAHAYNPSPWKVETGNHGQTGYVRLWLKTKENP